MKVRKIVALRGRYFTPPYPADTIVEVTSLYSPEALIEIEAIAVADDAVERREGRSGGSCAALTSATAARFSMIERQASASSLPLVTMCARKKSW